MTEQAGDGPDHDTVPVDEPPKRMLGNVLIDGPDGKCAYIHAGIEQRCQETAVAHTHVKHGGEWVRVEMCAEHAREDVPEFDEWEQEVLRAREKCGETTEAEDD